MAGNLSMTRKPVASGLKPLRLLVVEDSPRDAELVIREIRRAGYEVTWRRVENEPDMQMALNSEQWDLVISDYRMPHFDGLSALRVLQKAGTDLPFIIVSGTIGEELAVAAMKAGAHDYVLKNNLTRLVPAIERELRDAEIRQERRRLDQSIQDTARQWRTVFDAIHEAEALLDTDLKIVRCNRAMRDLIDKPWDRIIGHSCCPLVHGVAEPHAMCPSARARISLKRETWQTPIHDRWFDIIADPVIDETGKLTGIIHVLMDITDRKAAEQALSESEARYRTLFEDAQDGIALADASTGVLVDCNRALCRMVQMEKTDVIGKKQSILHPVTEPAESPSSTFCAHRDGDASRPMEDRLVSKDGKEIPVEIRAAQIRMEGRQYLLGVFRDLTERKSLEERFLRAQRLESIGALASGIAHDLNNVLMPIGLGVEQFRDEMNSPEQKDTLDMMQRSVQRGAGIIKQVLTFARGMHGERGQVQLRHLVDDMTGVMKETFPKTITASSEIPRDLWPVTGDVTQLGQVLMNLCVNARDAMPRGGAIRLAARNLMIDEHFAGMNPGANPGAHVELTVKDTGTGIPPDVLPRIFDPFFTTKDVGKGTGLGLATVHGIVKDHGGFMTVRTEVGVGTEFVVYLPADTGDATAPKIADELAPIHGCGQLILVVDDEAAVSQIMKATLEKHGYSVLLAADGAQALAVFAERKNDISAVVMDIGLPVLDGVMTASALRRIGPAVPIILMTGSPGRMSSLDKSKHVVLSKPFTREQLLVVLRELLEEREEAG